MFEILIALYLFLNRAEDIPKAKIVAEAYSSKSGYSDKDGLYSSKEIIEIPDVLQPLNKLYFPVVPPIPPINPPYITDVNPKRND
jgi:hypothetical protein